ncbi:MAG: L,D-transpeptidase family protein [Cyclobacteriaceae bacterium]|nr:L,D-transpeptidase family protein [Cyclobacteriaceae bacterium]
MPAKFICYSGCFLLFLFMISCSPRISRDVSAPDTAPVVLDEMLEKPSPKGFDVVETWPPESLTGYLHAFADSIVSAEVYKLGDEYIFSNTVLPNIYQKRLYIANWQNRKNREDAISSLENSWIDGLEPADYHLEAIRQLYDRIKASDHPTPADVAVLDILITDGLMLYASHLIKGKIDPKTLDVSWNFSGRDLPKDAEKIFMDAIETNKICEALYSLRPQHPMYQRFIDERIRYQRLKENGGWGIVSINRTIKPGEKSPVPESLYQRLLATSDITDSIQSIDSVYDGKLVEAVKQFQARHGLEPDGVIGKNTAEALNTSVDARIKQINVNMERMRWVVSDFSRDMVLINIAGYNLSLFHDSVRQFQTKVMVGTHYNQTPVLKSKLNYLVFNPSWSVPYSIATKEILPKLQEDSTYLAGKNMVLLSSQGKVVDPTTIDWKSVSANNFRYTVKQNPGPGNALGTVKFMFPNNYSVYLHDTPSRYLFAREERAFSHGCIRVQNPLLLAEILLQDKNWDMEKISEVIVKGEEKAIHLKKPIDVFLFYWTSGFLDNGEIYFIRDVYNRDQKIDQGLKNHDWKDIIASRPKKMIGKQELADLP